MKIIFHSPDKSSLTVLYGLKDKVEYGKEIGPKGLFAVWGYPKVLKLSKKLKNEDNQNKIVEYYYSKKNNK